MQESVLHGTCSGQVALIDEISFMSIGLLVALEHLRFKGVRLICFGDYRQLGPICNRRRGQKVAPDLLERSRLFWHWSGGAKFVLRRCCWSGQGHFDSRTGIRDVRLEEALERAVALYLPPSSSCETHSVLSHHKLTA